VLSKVETKTSLARKFCIAFLCTNQDVLLQEKLEEKIKVSVWVVGVVSLPCERIDQMRLLTCVWGIFSRAALLS
jgi:hypothetical protein